MVDFRDKGMGWKPSPPDQRDYRLELHEDVELPGGVDLREGMPPIWDQGQLGSCVSFGTGAAYAFDLNKQVEPDPDFDPSQLFIYYNGRALEGTTDYDSGLYIRDGIKALANQGAAPQSDWPYDINRFTEKPPQNAFDNGKLREAVEYAGVPQDLHAMKTVLAGGLPIVVGFTVYSSFWDAGSNGQVPLPSKDEKVEGGHCMVVVGYGSDKFIMRNSWGTGWGDGGYCYMPFEYLTSSDLSDDFWVVKSVSSPGPTPTPPPAPVDFLAVADHIKGSLDEAVADGTLTFVRDRYNAEGNLVSETWKKGGVEVLVKNLHPNA